MATKKTIEYSLKDELRRAFINTYFMTPSTAKKKQCVLNGAPVEAIDPDLFPIGSDAHYPHNSHNPCIANHCMWWCSRLSAGVGTCGRLLGPKIFDEVWQQVLDGGE